MSVHHPILAVNCLSRVPTQMIASWDPETPEKVILLIDGVSLHTSIRMFDGAARAPREFTWKVTVGGHSTSFIVDAIASREFLYEINAYNRQRSIMHEKDITTAVVDLIAEAERILQQSC